MQLHYHQDFPIQLLINILNSVTLYKIYRSCQMNGQCLKWSEGLQALLIHVVGTVSAC